MRNLFFNFAWIAVAATMLAIPAVSRADVVLSVDIDQRSVTDVQTGFDRLTLDTGGFPNASGTFGGIGIDVNAVGFTFAGEDRSRATPTNSGGLTQSALYRDFIFAPGTTTNAGRFQGLDTELTGLTPGQEYEVTIWSMDTSSGGVRTSDWRVLGAGAPKQGFNDYTFNGSNPPVADADNRFTFSAIADSNGELVIQGRQGVGNTAPQVFLNAIQLNQTTALPVFISPVANFDFSDTNAAGDLQSGFTAAVLSGGTINATDGGVSISVTPNGTANLDVRNRGNSPANAGSFTQSQILRDFVFATNSDGLEISVTGLEADQLYEVALWSFDTGSPGDRTSDWTVNGQTIYEDYVFDGGVLPLDDSFYQFGAFVTADANGELLISGRGTGTTASVFLNGLQISAVNVVPEPQSLLIWAIGVAGVSLLRKRNRR